MSIEVGTQFEEFNTHSTVGIPGIVVFLALKSDGTYESLRNSEQLVIALLSSHAIVIDFAW